MAARPKILASWYQVADQLALQVCERWPVILRRTAPTLSVRLIGYEVVVDELDRVARQTEQGLIGQEGVACSSRQILESGVHRPVASDERTLGGSSLA